MPTGLRRHLPLLAAPGLALALVGANAASLALGWHRLDSSITDCVFALLAVVAAFWGGMRASAAVVAIGYAYTLAILVPDGNMLGLPRAHVMELSSVGATYLALVGLLHWLLAQRDRADRLRLENELLAAQQADLTAKNEAVEALVAERTAALARSQRLLAEAESLGHMGSWAWDIVADEEVWSEELFRIYGLDPAEGPVDAERFIELTHPEDRARVREVVRRALDDREPFEFHRRVIRPDGCARVFLVRGRVEVDAQARPIRMVGMAQDVTERVAAERAIAEQNARLQELDRMKNDFVSAVSHDLRTPLTAIKGYVEFLEDGIGGPLTPEQAGFVAQVRSGTSRLEHLVDDLLDFARLEAGSFRLAVEPGDLTALAEGVTRLLQPIACERGIALALVEAPGPVRLRLDADRMEQVLLNLVANALKFTPPGGRVTLRVGVEGGAARLEVADTGRGIPEEALPRLFERFYQVDASVPRAKGGIGLGLTIAKALVEAHGGRIGVESTEGAGATFWLTLPIEPGAEFAPEAAQAPA